MAARVQDPQLCGVVALRLTYLLLDSGELPDAVGVARAEADHSPFGKQTWFRLERADGGEARYDDVRPPGHTPSDPPGASHQRTSSQAQCC